MLTGSFIDAIITFATDDDLTPEVDLGRDYDTLMVIIPAIDNAQVSIQVAEKSGGTYRNLHITDPADGGNNQAITAAGTGGITWIAPIGGFQFIKIATSAGQSANRTFRVAGRRS